MNENFSFNPEKPSENDEQEPVSLVNDLFNELEQTIPSETPNLLPAPESSENLAIVRIPKAVDMRGGLVQQIKAGEDFAPLLEEYWDLILEEVNNPNNSFEGREKKQILMNVHVALVWFESNNTEEGIEELYLTIERADASNRHDIADKIRDAIKVIKAQITE